MPFDATWCHLMPLDDTWWTLMLFVNQVKPSAGLVKYITTCPGGWGVGVGVLDETKANSAQLSWSWGWAWQYNEFEDSSLGITRKIFTKLESLKLRKYYFECALIFLNVILRSSILYASETYYGLTEAQVRQIERIEENFLRKLFKTSRGCPISQLYLESGHIPARF